MAGVTGGNAVAGAGAGGGEWKPSKPAATTGEASEAAGRVDAAGGNGGGDTATLADGAGATVTVAIAQELSAFFGMGAKGKDRGESVAR